LSRSTVALALACLVTMCRERPSGSLSGFPAVDAGPDLYAPARQPVTLTARLAIGGRPGAWTVSWGDSAVDTAPLDSGSALVTATHRYTKPGAFAVWVGVIGANGRTASDTLTAIVAAPGTPQVFVGAGDIAQCSAPDAAATARILDTVPGTVFALGDNAYPDGSARDYATCYAPTWGRHKKRTRPVPGNHDWGWRGAPGYFGYFGVAAGDPARGYYSYDLGAWHIAALNDNIDMRAGSPQEQWLRADLAAHPARCTLAYWHAPRFSSGTTHGSDPTTQPLWQALYDAGADVVLAGHEHNYERFAPQAPDGTLDSARGIREFVAGTGGGTAYRFGRPIAHSDVRSMDHGVLKLTLGNGDYHWVFIPVVGSSAFGDSGTARCHGA